MKYFLNFSFILPNGLLYYFNNCKIILRVLVFVMISASLNSQNIDNYQNMTFEFSFNVGKTFSFNLDSLESNSWSTSHQIITVTDECFLDKVNIINKQNFEYDFKDEIKDADIKNVLIDGNFIYVMAGIEEIHLYIYHILCNNENYNILGLKNIWKESIYTKKTINFMKKQKNNLILSFNDSVLLYNENYAITSQEIMNYSLTLLNNLSFSSQIYQPKLISEEENTDFSILIQSEFSNYLYSFEGNSLISLNNTDYFNNSMGSLISCMNIIFYQSDKVISIFNYDKPSISFIKNLEFPLENLTDIKRADRSLIFYNSSHVSEYIFVQDCLDLVFLAIYSIIEIYEGNNLILLNDKISKIFCENLLLVLVTNTKKVFIKRLQKPHEKFWIYKNSFSENFNIFSLKTLEFLPFHLEDVPILNYFDNKSKIIINTIEKAGTNLNCDLSSENLDILILTSSRFCDEKMYNYSETASIYNPKLNCDQYNYFHITKTELSFAVKITIIITTIIFGLCFFIFGGYVLRRWYRKKNKKSLYYDESPDKFDKEYEGEFEAFNQKKPTNLQENIFMSESARYRGNSPVTNTNRNLLNPNQEIELEKKYLKKDKSQFETSRNPLQMEDISFMTPQKSEENRGKEDIAEESKSQEAKLIFMKEPMQN